MSKRESGFYWVRIGLRWLVAGWHYNTEKWLIIGEYEPYYDRDFTEIDERPIVREDPMNGNWTGIKGNVERIPKDE